jgi:beta-galactosidase
MLKVGMRLGLNPECQTVTWYGRGPHESHCDRKTGQKIRLHRLDAEELEHRYVRPQENGNRTDVRTVAFTRADGTGLRVDAAKAINFSARYDSQESLDDAAHLYDRLPDPFLHLHIDGFQRGVGGDMPGCTYLHAPYKLKPRRYSYQFILRRAK